MARKRQRVRTEPGPVVGFGIYGPRSPQDRWLLSSCDADGEGCWTWCEVWSPTVDYTLTMARSTASQCGGRDHEIVMVTVYDRDVALGTWLFVPGKSTRWYPGEPPAT